jgi:hypothetical protein
MLAIRTPANDVQKLFNILEVQRPSGSQTEEDWVTNNLLSLEGARMDAYGNVFVEVSMDKSTTMFSCHTDTVHPKPHADFKNKLVIDPMTNHLFTDHKSQLGADDGTGIWFMLAMIEAKVPGLYAFHRDEEVGGLGSSESAKINKDYLAAFNLERCVAFDRHYYEDVITHQGGRCASDEFATALSNELNVTPGFKFKPCDSGVFTDSANYTHMIPECTNLSVGYWSQHTIKETQDVGFAEKLLDRLLQIDWESLPTVRDVTDNDFSFDDYGYDLFDRGEMDILDLCEEYPVIVAEILEECGIGVGELRQLIDEKLDLTTTKTTQSDYDWDSPPWNAPPWSGYK